MLTIWSKQSADAVSSFCTLHSSESGEALNPEKVSLLFSEQSPYRGYRLARIEIEPHIIKRAGGTHTISSRCLTYALLKTDDSRNGFAIIPITQQPHNVHEINDLLGFRVHADNIARYMTFYGHAILTPPFYFFYRLDQLNDWTRNVSPERQQQIRAATLAIFSVDDRNELDLNPTIKDYLFIGRSFVFELPCFHEGALFVAKCSLSENGRAQMLDDRPLQIQEIFDTEESRAYYPLDPNPQLGQKLQTLAAKSSKAAKTWLAVFDIDNKLQILLLPLFLFHLYVIIFLGLKGPAVAAYFEHLKQSSVLTFASVFFGVTGTAIAMFRYLFLEIIVFFQKRLPGIWSYTAAEFHRTLQQESARFGRIPVFTVLALEHSLKAVMSLTLLVYGISNALPVGIPGLNFGQALVLVLTNIPFVKALPNWVFKGTAFAPVTLPDLPKAILATLVGFVFSTILIGILTRIFAGQKKKT